MVLARFDLPKTYREFMFAFFIPTVLFIVSFISLCIIQRTVKVDDDAKMRCKYCTEGEETSDLDDDVINKVCSALPPLDETEVDEPPQASTSNVSISFKIPSYIFFFIFRFETISWQIAHSTNRGRRRADPAMDG